MSRFYKFVKRIFSKLFGNPRLYKSDMPYFKQCQIILDIPCGRGIFIGNDLQRIVGVDFNNIGLREAKRSLADVIQANGMQLPFRNNVFDGIHCAHFIEHLTPEKLLILFKEINRILKNGGVLVLRSPFMHKLFYNDPSHAKPYPPSAVMNMLNMTQGGDPTLCDYMFCFEFVDLSLWRRNLFQLQYEVSVAPQKFLFRTFLMGLGKILGELGIKHWEKAEYRLVLRKK